MDIRNIDTAADGNASSEKKKDTVETVRNDVLNRQDSSLNYHYKVIETKEEFFDAIKHDQASDTESKNKKKSKTKNSLCTCFGKANASKD